MRIRELLIEAAVKKSEDALENVPPVLQDKIKAAALKWW